MELSEDEKKAIEELKGIDIRCFFSVSMEVSDFMIDKAEEINEYIKTILTLIEKQQKEIELKDKVIDGMINYIIKQDNYIDKQGDYAEFALADNSYVKNTFINKAKENKE